MNLTMLGTGHALVTKYYNTCFVLTGDDGKHFLVDGGGGNTILSNLEKVGIDPLDIREIFVTHQHIDHLLGIIWMVRVITYAMSKGEYEGDAYIYANCDVVERIRTVATLLLRPKESDFIDKKLHLVSLEDGEEREVIGCRTKFFDIGSTKVKQYGFTMEYEADKWITCLGDEPYYDSSEEYVEDSEWLMHEAFCLYEERDIYHPYEIAHSTVKDACEVAKRLNVSNILLYHTEDDHFDNREVAYKNEGMKFFDGRIEIPSDLEVIEL